jgi:hypothetical protein
LDNWTANYSHSGTRPLTRQLSPHMQLGTPMIPYLTMGPQTSSESMPFNIAKIFVSWTWVKIASFSIMSHGSRIARERICQTIG